MTEVRLIHASARSIPIADESVQCVVTSPPYWGLRQYAGEQIVPEWGCALGLEPTPELYVEHMVDVFREVRRVLRKDGTLWLNLGDSYAGGGYSNHNGTGGAQRADGGKQRHTASRSVGLKPKDLVGIPWMVAFALRADGWYLRSDIIWHKPNPMPESVTDRPTKAHEYLFLLSKAERYYYDADAIREPLQGEPHAPGNKTAADWESVRGAHVGKGMSGHLAEPDRTWGNASGRNKRTVWTIPTRPYKGAHFATFPPDLVEPCVLAGSSPKACGVCGAPWERVSERTDIEDASAKGSTFDGGKTGARDGGDRTQPGPRTLKVTTGWRPTCEHEDDSGSCVVLDPFNGSGTTGQVAVRLGRSYVGVDISKEYLDEQAGRRIYDVQMEAAL